MRFLITAIALVWAFMAQAMAGTLVPMKDVNLSPEISVRTHCAYESLPQGIEQCVIYSLEAKTNQTNFDPNVLNRVQFQRQHVAFILSITAPAQATQISITSNVGLPNNITWASGSTANHGLLFGQIFDLVFISMDGGRTWSAYSRIVRRF